MLRCMSGHDWIVSWSLAGQVKRLRAAVALIASYIIVNPTCAVDISGGAPVQADLLS